MPAFLSDWSPDLLPPSSATLALNLGCPRVMPAAPGRTALVRGPPRPSAEALARGEGGAGPGKRGPSVVGMTWSRGEGALSVLRG